MKITLDLFYQTPLMKVEEIMSEIGTELADMDERELRDNLPYHQDVHAEKGQMIGHWVVTE